MSFVKKLIENVQDYEELYNLKHENFRRLDIKEQIWQNIAKELNTTVDHCKNRWKSLRDKFIKISREMLQPCGSAADLNHEIKWKYYPYLTFLHDFNKAERYKGKYFEENIIESAHESVQRSACDLSKERPCARKNDLENEFKKVLNTGAKATQAETSNTKSYTYKLFEALAQSVEEANLPNQRLQELHMAMAKLVYESI